MTVFDAYARYYDLLYRDKDYAGEARFVLERLEAHGPCPESLLDLGCGTGAHCRRFLERVPQVHGLDRSRGMIERALAGSAPDAAWPRYHLGDVRQARLGFSLDAVVSLFHVASYQTTNADLEAMLATARAHLRPGGLFLFDFWYGPAVLSAPPAVRIRRVEDQATRVTRISEPRLDHRACTVEVAYRLFVSDKASGRVEELTESHLMRYLFEPELALLAQAQGFGILETAPWMEAGRPPAQDDFGVYAVLRRLP